LGAGVVAGFLYPPKPGRKTRENVAAGAREDTEHLRARSRQAEEAVSAIVEQSKQQVAASSTRARRR
jgi:gas vesicle protein